MKLQHGLAVFGLLCCLAACKEKVTSSTGDYGSAGDYASSLGAVIGAIYYMPARKEICEDAYPAFKDQNEQAYQGWRTKYRAFLQEIKQHQENLYTKVAKGDPNKLIQIWDDSSFYESERRLELLKEGMREELSRKTKEDAELRCSNYPRLLDASNLEAHFAADVAIIRKGETQR